MVEGYQRMNQTAGHKNICSSKFPLVMGRVMNKLLQNTSSQFQYSLRESTLSFTAHDVELNLQVIFLLSYLSMTQYLDLKLALLKTIVWHNKVFQALAGILLTLRFLCGSTSSLVYVVYIYGGVFAFSFLPLSS